MPALSALWARRAAVVEIALYLGAYFIYAYSKGLVHDDTLATGLANGKRLVSFQDGLGLLLEPGWQAWAIENVKALVVVLNWAYIVTFWPTILAMALVLFVCDRKRYHFYRTVVLVNLAGALVVFMLFPVASPFAIPTVDLQNTIQDYGPRFYGSEGMAAYYNVSAAMPSLHFSWTVILGVLFWRTLTGWYRALGLLYPVVTFFAIVITGNHFIVDAAAGGALALISFGLVALLQWTVWRVKI